VAKIEALFVMFLDFTFCDEAVITPQAALCLEGRSPQVAQTQHE
jgi:hypothetical protein